MEKTMETGLNPHKPMSWNEMARELKIPKHVKEEEAKRLFDFLRTEGMEMYKEKIMTIFMTPSRFFHPKEEQEEKEEEMYSIRILQETLSAISLMRKEKLRLRKEKLRLRKEELNSGDSVMFIFGKYSSNASSANRSIVYFIMIVIWYVYNLLVFVYVMCWLVILFKPYITDDLDLSLSNSTISNVFGYINPDLMSRRALFVNVCATFFASFVGALDFTTFDELFDDRIKKLFQSEYMKKFVRWIRWAMLICIIFGAVIQVILFAILFVVICVRFAFRAILIVLHYDAVDIMWNKSLIDHLGANALQLFSITANFFFLYRFSERFCGFCDKRIKAAWMAYFRYITAVVVGVYIFYSLLNCITHYIARQYCAEDQRQIRNDSIVSGIFLHAFSTGSVSLYLWAAKLWLGTKPKPTATKKEEEEDGSSADKSTSGEEDNEEHIDLDSDE